MFHLLVPVLFIQPACADRVPQCVGPGKDFFEKNGLLRSNGSNWEMKTKRDIVMIPKGKIVHILGDAMFLELQSPPQKN